MNLRKMGMKNEHEQVRAHTSLVNRPEAKAPIRCRDQWLEVCAKEHPRLVLFTGITWYAGKG